MRRYSVNCAEGFTKTRSCDCKIFVLFHEKKSGHCTKFFTKSCQHMIFWLFAYGAVLIITIIVTVEMFIRTI